MSRLFSVIFIAACMAFIGYTLYDTFSQFTVAPTEITGTDEVGSDEVLFPNINDLLEEENADAD